MDFTILSHYQPNRLHTSPRNSENKSKKKTIEPSTPVYWFGPFSFPRQHQGQNPRPTTEACHKTPNIFDVDKLQKGFQKKLKKKKINPSVWLKWQHTDKHAMLDITPPPQGTESQEDMQTEKIEKAIASMKSRQAPGIYVITAEVLNTGGKPMVVMLHKIFNTVYDTKKTQGDSARIMVTPIHKKAACKRPRTIAQ